MKKTIRDFAVEGKKVIIRSDFNVPLKDGKIIDDTRIKKGLETIKYALDHNAKVIVLSHLGRVKTEEDLVKNNLEVVAKRLEELLDRTVKFIDKTRGKEVEEKVQSLKEGEIVLLQNTRYEDLDGKKESNCDDSLAKYWACLGDVFVNDAFGTLHRRHASNVGISKYLDSGIGLLVEKELKAMSHLQSPDHPYIMMLGGAKVQDKIALIDKLLPTCDKMLIGGGMAFTFLKADGYEVGNSLVDSDSLSYCQKLLTEYVDKIILPVDVVCSNEMSENSMCQERDINEIEFDEMGLDIGSKTVSLFERYLETARIVFWNGPMGVYEFSKYRKGTEDLLKYIAENEIPTVLGGGDIVAAATTLNLTEHLYHVSTGGGATLEYLEGKELPGLKEIKERS